MVNDPASAGLASGTCCGFELHTPLPLQTLRPGAGTPLHVRAGGDQAPSGDTVLEWPERREHPFHGRLLRDGDRYSFWASDAGWFIVDPADRTILVETGDNPLQRELRLFGIPTSLCVLERGDISVHAAAVDVGGVAVLLAGPSRYGKTTLAAAFARAGDRLLAEDTTTCTTRFEKPAVYPGPAAVRLRRDVASELHLPGIVETDEGGDRVRTVLDPGTRGDGSAVPLGAVLFLRDVAETPELVPVPVATAIRDVWALTFRLPTDDSQAATFERVTDLVSQVPAFDLRRPATMAMLPKVIDLVRRTVSVG